jgi:voltage-gated potassium channel
VGYGDFYPVTLWGRITAAFIMIAGVGIIGVLASLLSDMLIGRHAAPDEEEFEASPAVEQELAAIKSELAEMRQMLKKLAQDNDTKTSGQ